MRKYILCAFATLCLCTFANAQNINKIEYFIDADPGYGAGTDVPITAATPVTANFNVSVGSVADGFHFLSVRAKDVSNNWSVVGTRPFYKEAISTATVPNITSMEYFIDADPGYGLATNVAVTAGSPITQNFTASLSSVSDGFHFLSLRAKDVNNRWSVVAVRPFYKEAVSTATVPNITAMEYFIDSDPGYGLATNVPVTAGSPVTQNFTASLTFVTDGFHFISIRAKDANNKWSVVAIRPFYKETLSNSTIPNIVAMEYFIDADPGFGAGTTLSFTAGSPISQMITANLGSLSNGTHKLSIRAKDSNNKWSIVGIKDFTVQDNIIVLGAIPPVWCQVTNFNIPFTVTGTYTAGNVFTAQLSNSSGTFTSGTTNLGTLTSTAAGTIVANVPNTVTLGSNYQIRLISSTPSITNSSTKAFSVVSICPPPCAGLLNLQSPADDYSSGIITKEANATTGEITANNKITGSGTNVTYRAGKSITLNAGFKAENGTVFKTEFGGCN